ncbi:hypothetical protein BH09BAC6_BH09BAC6_31250 [soil metagenome]|jgi:hypothetical protein
MKIALKIFKQHWIAITAYSIYLLIWYSTFTTQLRFKAALPHIGEGERVAWGEGVMYGDLLTLALGIGGGIVMLLNAIIYKAERKFYLLMSPLLIIPAIIFIYRTGFLV